MCSLQRNYDVIRNWERFETGPLTVTELHRYHTEFLDADIFRLVYSRGINILKLKVGALI